MKLIWFAFSFSSSVVVSIQLKWNKKEKLNEIWLWVAIDVRHKESTIESKLETEGVMRSNLMVYEREIQFPDIELNQLQLNYKWHSFRSNVAIDFALHVCASV